MGRGDQKVVGAKEESADLWGLRTGDGQRELHLLHNSSWVSDLNSLMCAHRSDSG